MRSVLLRRIHVRSILSLLVAGLAVGAAGPVLASTADGTIDTTSRYAWSENAGWIDFGTSEGNVHVADSALTGYAWSELAGWISLNCSNTSSCATVEYKVTNDSEGTLGGYAWSENAGWIDFDPANGGVTIGSDGTFSGTAWGELVGWIVFNCATTSSCATTDYKVATDWRPASTRSSGASSSVAPSATGTVDQGRGGRRGSTTAMQQRIALAHTLLLARYQDALTQAVAQGGVSSAPSSSSARMVARATSSRSGRVTPSPSPRPVAPSSPPSPAAPLRQDLPAIAERRGMLLVMADDAPILYRDVETRAWYAPYVADLAANGIAQGYRDEQGNPTGEFGVANPVTRAEVLKMALEAAGKAPDAAAKVAPQNRTARGTWAAPYVKRAEDLGISVFLANPDVHAPATRGEVIQIVLDALGFVIGKTPSTFADVPADHPYGRAIALAAFNGFIEGDRAPDGRLLNRFRPDDSINRAEVAKLIALVRATLAP